MGGLINKNDQEHEKQNHRDQSIGLDRTILDR